ncbi:MAG: ABC transporter ATP-binding protein [Candidatus Thermoplasmatota archaeon]|nr:ABC transporter ATP-binding protein [Candidatus Thermoplasmatota archaeon]MEC7494372.1 ABC transporter ATP-binding protein [Candidatus Thermoplasmatota archaeon]MEC8671816.1 ABC transporter ATP-binding protein [Candidatus Thermoplasmatota archaeon]
MNEQLPISRLLAHTKNHRSTMWLGTLFSILNKIFDLAPPLLIGAAVDVVVKREESALSDFGYSDPKEQLILLSILTIIIWVFESLFEYIYGVLWRNLAQTVQHELRLDAYSHIQNLEMEWFGEQSKGELMSILNDDINQLERFLDKGANEILQVSTTVVIIGAIFLYISPTIALYSICAIPFIVIGSFMFQSRIAPRYTKVRKEVGLLNALLSNNLSGISTIKSFTTEELEIERVRKASQAYREANRDAIKLSAAFVPLIRMAILVGFTGTLLHGGLITLEGKMAIASYSVMIFMMQRLLWPLTRLGETFDLYQRAMVSTTRVLNLLETEIRIEEGSESLDLTQVKGNINFEKVSFSYPGRELVVNGFDLNIKPGSTQAIVGPTGSGKTTLVRLLLRFHVPNSGSIFLDGTEISKINLKDLRSSISLVTQTITLFPGTVLQNIAYGNKEYSKSQIINAAKVAEIHDFVESLPDGYSTQIGEGGHKLSGGQRQRISIARAILKDAPILVLDEATSSVDNETEEALQKSLDFISKNRTTIVIAHRLSTIRHSDSIIVLDCGKVVEAGNHDELIANKSNYYRLWNVQTGVRE